MENLLRNFILIFIGGGLGSVCRYLTGIGVSRLFSSSWPLGTWLVNIVGSFLIGLLAGLVYVDDRMEEFARMFLIIGFCGGFTTFSAFSYENLKLLQEGQFFLFLLYSSTSICLGITLVYMGYWCGNIA